ncbi:hypothetical protein [Malaciobacter canalis]|uniref:hypothetical protein n=1 Tax=Malaciobacter canalis TaxID=1912871 RepID=UPI00384DBB3C
MSRIYFLFFLFISSVYAKNGEIITVEKLNIILIFILGSCSVLYSFYCVFFFEKKDTYNTFQVHSKYLLKEMNFSNYGRENYIKDLFLLKDEILKKLTSNNVYYIIYNKSNKFILSSSKIDKNNIDDSFDNIKRSLYNTENSVSFFSLPMKKFYVNYKFYFLLNRYTNKFYFYSIKQLLAFISVFSLLSYSVINSYIYEMIKLSGIPLSLIDLNISILFQKIFTELFLIFSQFLIYACITVPLIFIIHLLSFWKKYNNFFPYLGILSILNTSLLLLPIGTFFIVMIYQPILTLYKIEIPNYRNIKMNDINISIGDYLKFKEGYRILEKDNKYKLMVGYDNKFILYYNIEENKNIFLSKELELVKNKKELKNCKEIIDNLNFVKSDEKFDSYKLDTILINNQILNGSFLKRIPIKDLSKYTQRSVNLTKDLKVNEIINKCEIMANLKDENINYENFEKMSNKELIKWIDNLKYSQKDKINEVKSRIELEIKENKKNTN